MRVVLTIMICFAISSGCNSQRKEVKTKDLEDTLKCPDISGKGYFRSPYGIKSYYDYEEGLICSKASKRPYLVYFTGFGSTESREMEVKVISDNEILNLIKNEFVVTTLYVDDKSKLKKEKQIKSELTGDTIKTFGPKQAYIEYTKFNNKKIPAFFIVDFNGQVLTNPIYFDLDKKTFLEFLISGIKAYKLMHVSK